MTKLTPEEVQEHKKRIKSIRDRAARAKDRYYGEDITLKKLKSIEKEVRKEENDYLRDSGIILYFGNLFKVS